MHRSRRLFIAAALLPAAWARADTAHEAALKARLTYNLARFAQWPASTFASPSDPLVICVAHASDTVAAAFGALEGQLVAGRPITVVLRAEGAIRPCQVLFVQDMGTRGGPAWPAMAAGAAALTIGDSEGFATRGGMVELVNVNDTLRFDVNLKTLRSAQIGLSSQVLKLARQVRE
jgi:YfiR/HmsC-like